MTAGIFGKVPAHADFVHRGLPTAFVDPFAAWLETVLHGARDTLGEEWEAAYLAAPVWCFAFDPEVVGDTGWVGVLATSIDAVGRYYPIAIAASLDPSVTAGVAAEMLHARVHELEGLALSLVDGSATPDAVMENLAAFGTDIAGAAAAPLTFRNRYGADAGIRLSHTAYPPIAELKALRGGAPSPGAFRTATKATFWWHYGWPGRDPEAVRMRGLPDPEAFVAFIDGAWDGRGWTP